MGIILKLRTDADTTIGVQENKTADMHVKIDGMMYSVKSIDCIAMEQSGYISNICRQRRNFECMKSIDRK